MILKKIDNKLSLGSTQHPELNPIYIDFLAGELAFRRLHGGGKNQLLAKAVGLHKRPHPRVLDLSAGLMRDAFILACLGADVVALERNVTIAALITDALQRAQSEDWFCELKLEFMETQAQRYLTSTNSLFDVIYFDPMFPERNKSALVKKEMRLLREAAGDDEDCDAVFQLALSKAKQRVVVKRPKLAPNINNQKPDLTYAGKSARFDVYLL